MRIQVTHLVSGTTFLTAQDEATTAKDIALFLERINDLSYMNVSLDNGNQMFMNKAMIGQCVFEIVP